MNKYSRVRQIGEGAFGKAILVKRKDSSKQCVIKEVNIIKMTSKEREQARKEVAVLAQLKHPNIVSYIESFEEKGSLYIVMNYCSGGDLFGKIHERRGQLFSEDQILDWFVQLCLAVKHIHDRKILHRDIKCQNIFLTQSGTIQLGDFGIAKVLSSTVQLAHTCIGTPYYLSPEIVENMPYNNKSDIWSIGCVLYELTTLKHAFEAANMKNLVLKIIRGSYPPISPQFSYDLRGLIGQLFKRNPRDRPSVNSILRKNFVMQRVRRLLSAQDLADEFSHTVMHGHKIAKALPPAPKPSSDPARISGSPIPRPGSAAKKYDPAAVYGVPLSSSKNRMSGDQKKRPSTPGRQLPIPGQVDWEKKKKERQDAEERRRADIKKREQELNDRRYRDYVEKQKVARMNKVREEGWRNLVSPNVKDEVPRTPTPSNNQSYSPRPLPVPKVNQQKNNRDRGNYEAYNEYLDKLYKERNTPPAADPRPAGNPNHIDVVNIPPPQQWPPVPKQQFNMGPLGVPIPSAIDQAGRDRYSYNMQLGAQAAQRARMVEDYIQRQRQAALNKMRAQHDLFGVYRPLSADRRTPVPAPRQGSSPKHGQGGGGSDDSGGDRRSGGGGLIGRNREEQEYLEKLRQIRLQNMKDRRAIGRANVAEDADRGKKSPGSEERRKKVEALKGKSPTPVPAVPITGALLAIGASDRAQQQPLLKDEEKLSPVPLTNAMQAIAGVVPAKENSNAELERPKSALQMRKDIVLKKLNEKNPSRGKWGAPASPAITVLEEVERGKWGSPAPPNINMAANKGADNSRAQWGDGKGLHLSKVSLETTGSKMEATGEAVGVINMVAESQNKVTETVPTKDNHEVGRGRWGRNSNVVRILDKMPIYEDTVTLDDTLQPVTPTPPVGVGATIVITSQKVPPAQGRTITISGIDEARATVVLKKQINTSSQLPPERSNTVVLSRDHTVGKNVPIVDEPDSGQAKQTSEEKEATQRTDILETINNANRDGAKSVQMNLTNGNFDLKNTELLRTCSEPDLAQLSRTLVSGIDDRALSVTPSIMRRHYSLDMTPVTEKDENEDVEDDFSEEDIAICNDNENDDDSEGDDADEEDEDMKSVRETMQSLLEDGDDEDEDKTNQQEPLNEDTTNSNENMSTIKKAPKKKGDKQNIAENKADENDVACDGDISNDVNDEMHGEKTYLALSLDLENDDSDNETTFGDDDDDNDRFGRLEELRKDLEMDLGVGKLLEVYQTVQKLQEDEEGSIEDDAKLALKLLGSEKQHLFAKIFQLVMSDTAFTEG